MFSGFKNLLEQSLNELDRLAEASENASRERESSETPRTRHRELQQQHQQQQYAQYGRSSSESVLSTSMSSNHGVSISPPASSSRPLQAAGSFSTMSNPMSSSVDSLPLRQSIDGYDGASAAGSQWAGSPAQFASFGLVSPLDTAPSVLPSSTTTATAAGNSRDYTSNASASDGFPSFGLGTLKRSLSGSIRNSLDLNLSPSKPNLSLLTGSSSQEWPSLTFQGPSSARDSPKSKFNTPPQRRRHSARAASLSGMSGFGSLSGPFSPQTMHQQDPFFFASLQGLPDDLKIAAFTPLPKEDEDEELEQIDAELSQSSRPLSKPSTPNSQRQGLGIAGHGRSVSVGFRPSSAPSTSFLIPPARVATPPSVRSPLADPAVSLMAHVMDEVDEPASNAPSAANTPLGKSTALPSEHIPSHTPVGPQDVEEDKPSQSRPLSPTVEKGDPLGAIVTQPSATSMHPLATELTTPSDDAVNAAEAKISEPVDPLSEPSAVGIAARSDGVSAPSAEELPRSTQAELTPVVPSFTIVSTSPTSSRALSPAPPTTAQDTQTPPTVDASIARAASPNPKKPESLAERLARAARGSTVSPRKSLDEERPSSPLQSSSPKPVAASLAPPDRAKSPVPPSPSIPIPSRVPTPSNADDTLPAYKRLQADKLALDKLLHRYTSLSSASDLDAFEAFLKTAQARSNTSELDNLRKRVQEAELKSAQLESETKEAKAAATRAETKAKDEEEKKAKSISLLKAVRQKLIKAEKDKEEAEVLRDAAKNSEEQYGTEVRTLKQRYDQETLGLRTAQEQQLSKLKSSFDREANSIRVTYEREASARKGQYELDLLSLRSAHTRDISVRDTRINTLEMNLKDLRREKDEVFDRAETRQAEVEAATSEQERIQVAMHEMEYELKEARDRALALQEEVASFKKARLDQTRDEGHTRRLLADLEASNADKLQEYEDRVRTLERERSETEAQMARQLQEKLREVERMRREIERRDAESSEETQRREERQLRTERAEGLSRQLQDKVNALEMLLNEAKEEAARIKEEEVTTRELLADQTRRTSELESRTEELQSKEVQLRSSNKTLREELRKVQSGVLLSERSRNPGVGYFSNFSPSSPSVDARSPPFSPPVGDHVGMNGAELREAQSASGTSKPLASSASSAGTPGAINPLSGNDERALNFEYVRNVILQFLEHKEMRPHLVSVLGVILQFTPAETRRLAAKASS